MPLWFLLWLALLAINALTFLAWGVDKRRAIAGSWRIKEGDLLMLAALGGTGGAYLGRWYFRHKTRKAQFSMALHAVAFAQTLVIGWMIARS